MWATSAAQLSAQQKAAIEKGKALEVVGDFQGAYDVYKKAALLPPTQGGTQGGYGILELRALAMVFLRPSKRTRHRRSATIHPTGYPRARPNCTRAGPN